MLLTVLCQPAPLPLYLEGVDWEDNIPVEYLKILADTLGSIPEYLERLGTPPDSDRRAELVEAIREYLPAALEELP